MLYFVSNQKKEKLFENGITLEKIMVIKTGPKVLFFVIPLKSEEEENIKRNPDH